MEKIKKGYVEYAAKRQVVTTTIPYELWAYLKDNDMKLSRWIDQKLNDRSAESTVVLHSRIDALARRLDEQCKQRIALEKRLELIEPKKVTG